ncbi:MAG: dTDP-4-dehydrorhamnose reductase [Acidobacteria bacterium]|jgi:dTDP-4-dehydrorhamnose reductase|nr:MAG: dTDP-4-dehydrorhamnose reductase [Acidobacteriota bacterium]GIU82164.1 MAG: NAD(P)-dependent oxidoreductase [Pyrinomonadaceae bacterium]
MKILVTGANGMLARATIAHCKAIGDEVIGLTRQELDISNRTAVFSFFEENEFDAVINCAAYTDVDGSETNVERCYATNALGVENLALASRKHNRLFLTVSTDYVFDGTKSGFYTQRDTPNPQGVYGKAKLEGEIRARNLYARSIIVRSGWIYGEGGTNFLSVLPKLLERGEPIKAINDSFGTPTYAVDLAKRMRELLELDLPLIFHVTNSGEGANYAEFAKKVCRLKGLDEHLVEEISALSLKRPAPRPKNSRLACLFSERLGLKPLRYWEEALEEFVLQAKTAV